MTALLHAELLKLRTTRTFVALTSVAVGTSLAIAALVSLLTRPTQDSVLTDVFTIDTSVIFILVLAVVGISGEWRHRTIASSLLAAPDRLRFLAAKTLAFAAAGLVMSLAISTAVAIVGASLLSLRDLPLPGVGELAVQLGRNALTAALLGALGVGIGAVVRNQVVAIVGVLVVAFAVEPVVIGFVPRVGRFGPFDALPSAVQGVPGADVGLAHTPPLAGALALALMVTWIGIAFAAGAARLCRSDP
jgi:ABC-2 type transport system permease protein